MSSKRHPAPQQARSLLENHALEALGIALLQLDTQKCITSVNEPALMLLGTKDAAWLGRDFSEAFLPVDGGAPLELARSAETQWVSLRATSGDTERPVRAGILAVEGGYLIRLQPSLVAMDPERLGEMLATESAKVAEWTTQLSRGDFVVQLELTAQNDDNGIVLELLRPIVDATRAFRDQVIAVLNEARLLATAATQGRLHVRADPSNHAGEFARTVAELNQALSATTEPIALMAAQLADLAEGKIPPALPTAFSGDFSVMQVALDRCAAGLAGLREVALGLSALSRNDTSHGVDLSLPGVFGDIVSETNQLRRQMLRLTTLSQRVSAGDLSDLVELEAVGNGRGRMCENDRLTPAFIQLIRAILALSDEAAALLAAARAGDLTRRADDRGLCGRIRDAVASINETLDVLQAPIETAIGVLESVARQDLRARVTGDFRGNHGRLQAAINQMADLLHSSIESVASNGRMVEANAQQLLAATQSMSSNAEQTSNRARTASQAVEEVDEHVQSVAAAIQQMTASINEIARNGADAMRVAQDATKVADGASSIVTSLGKSSKQISRVLSVIDTIAQQTKLLALNATIEAASAGEAGKGFAVVAGEVKELAKGTARATEDISEKVEAIQASVAGAINAISEITTVIHRIEKSQAAIASAVEEQTATTVEIAQRVAESAQRTSELSTNLSGLAVAASRTTELASDSRSASIHLRDMAERLLKTVAGYQI